MHVGLTDLLTRDHTRASAVSQILIFFLTSNRSHETSHRVIVTTVFAREQRDSHVPRDTDLKLRPHATSYKIVNSLV